MRSSGFAYSGCPSVSSESDNEAIISFLREQSEDVIVGFADTSKKVAPIPDGHVLPINYQELYANGDYVPRSVMLGCNNDEGQLLWNYMAATLKAAGIPWNINIARTMIQRHCMWMTMDKEEVVRIAATVIAEYLPDDTEDTAKAMVEFLTDYYFISKNIIFTNQCSRTFSNYRLERRLCSTCDV